MTKDGAFDLKDTRDKLIITDETLHSSLEELEQGGFIQVRENVIEASVEQRLELAIHAIKLGADFEKISNSLGWLEFEELVAHVFRENGYNTKSRYRFISSRLVGAASVWGAITSPILQKPSG